MLRYLQVLIGVLVVLSSCKDDVTDSVIPEYNVNYSCNATLVNAYLRQTNQIGLDCQGGYVRVFDKKNLSASDVVGVGGLLILQSYEGAFYAFDLACPYCYSKGKRGIIEVKDDGFTAICPKCTSEYGAVFWGSPAPTSGPANAERLILRQYRAQKLMDGVTITVSR